MTVRRLGIGEEDSARRVLARFDNAPDEVVGSFLADPCVFLYVAEQAGDPVGRVYGYELPHPRGGRDLLLFEIDVDEHARRQGHGRALVESVLADARLEGYREVWVLTEPDNEAATALYAATGGARDADAAMFTWKLKPQAF